MGGQAPEQGELRSALLSAAHVPADDSQSHAGSIAADTTPAKTVLRRSNEEEIY